MIGGVRQKTHFFCMDLPKSDGCFVRVSARGATGDFFWTPMGRRQGLETLFWQQAVYIRGPSVPSDPRPP